MIQLVPLLEGASARLHGRVCANFCGYIRVLELTDFMPMNHWYHCFL